MPLFFSRFVPPRPTFPLDMTEAERVAMEAHGAYWRAQAKRGVAIAFGPVFDPKGAYGVGIAEVASEEEMRALWEADPVVAAGLGFAYEIHPMPSVILREAQAREAIPTA